MKSGVCPKCAGQEIFHIPGQAFSLSGRPNVIPAGWFSGVTVGRYVCGKCGYSEEWVETVAALQRLREHYAAVRPPDKQSTSVP